MCLAVPGKILDTEERDGLRSGRVQFGGIVRQVNLDFVPEANPGDYVLVHVGFAISRVDATEAMRTELPPDEPVEADKDLIDEIRR
jgi:hydrogenase expression/formation protein HypC